MRLLIFLFFSLLLVSTGSQAIENDNSKFLDDMLDVFTKGCKEEKGIDYLNCWADHSPSRCKSLVYAQRHQAWSRCVYSCGSASFYSKNFGDCSF